MRDQIFARFVKNKKRVAILRGGPSSEHATSLKSGANIIENLDKDKYIPVDIYIDKKGSFYLDGVVTTPYAALQFIDVAFSTIHGEFGEDGKIQAILEEVGVLYVGTDSFISSLAIDKHISKLLLTQAGVKVARHKLIRPHTENLDKVLARIWQTYMHPLIIKPTSLGSSLGMSTVTDFVNLKKQVKKLLEKDITLMVEEFVKGEEVSVSVIENMRGEELYVPIPIHIKHDKQFFDQEVKESGKFINQPMINFTESQRKFLIEAARFIHKKLHLRHFSRVDFIVTPKKVYFLEVNTVPGMTEGSILPASLKESGISMKEFISHLLEEAMSSFKKK